MAGRCREGQAQRQTWLLSRVSGGAGGALSAPFLPVLARTIRSPWQVRATLGLLPSALPMALSAEPGRLRRCGPREEVVEEEGSFPLLLCKNHWQSPKARFSHQVETIPDSQVSPRAPVCSGAVA